VSRELAGILLPVPTPFDPESEVSAVAFRSNLRRWLAEPIAGVVVAGSTGEAPALDEDEVARLVEWARELVDADRWLVAGTGAESTRAAIRRSRAAAAAGADAVMVRAPSYYRPLVTPAVLRGYYEAVADASPVPVIVYDVPQFVPVTIAPELVATLARHPNVVGIKASGGDLRALGAVLEAVPAGFSVLVGSGALLYAGLEMGAVGGVVAVGCLAPRETAELYLRWRERDAAAAGRLQTRVGPLHEAVVARLGVPGIKAALDLLGYAGGPPRPPLLPLAERDRAAVARALERAGLRPAPTRQPSAS
jgi:4-hydroxy-2-oxoglutarate aldolase